MHHLPFISVRCDHLKTRERNMLEALFSKRIVVPFLLLLLIVILDNLFVRPVFSELDILEHLIFGFLISETGSCVAKSLGLVKWTVKKVNSKSVRQPDLVVRLIAFLVIGGLAWESLECFVLPTFGWQCNPFLVLPITLHNIDGTIDVAVGILGCLLAWYTGG